MRRILTKLTLLLLAPMVSYTQGPPPKSASYQEMFPNNVDERRLLIILPSQVTKAQMDSLLPDLSPSQRAVSYESHVRRTEKTIANVQKCIQKYGIKGELVHQADYNKQKYPSDTFSLVIYPDVITVNNLHVSHAYRMLDVSNNIRYGYVMNSEATYEVTYFKQLDEYVKTLRTQKNGQTNNQVLSQKIENDFAEKQGRKNRIRAIAIGAAIALLVIVPIVLRSSN